MARRSASETIKPSMYFVTPESHILKWYPEINPKSIKEGERKTIDAFHSAMVNLSKKASEKKVPFNDRMKQFYHGFLGHIKGKVPEEKKTIHKEIPISRDMLGEFKAAATYHIDENKNANDLTFSVFHTFDNPFVKASKLEISPRRRAEIVRKLRRLGYI